MTKIYDQHAATFAKVSAFVILDTTGERVATVALKFPTDGAGLLYAYFHLIGVEMVRAYAGGYGYDKRSAAIAAAIAKIPAPDVPKGAIGRADAYTAAIQVSRAKLQSVVQDMDSGDWTRVIEKAGFRVLQAV
jgi:hypothetical protein